MGPSICSTAWCILDWSATANFGDSMYYYIDVYGVRGCEAGFATKIRYRRPLPTSASFSTRSS